MLNSNGGFRLTSNMIDIIKEGVNVQATKINKNKEKIKLALIDKDNSLTVEQIEEMILVNQVLQKQINEAEEILNKPMPRGI